MKNTWGYVLFIGIVLLVLFALSSSKKAPLQPGDAQHRAATTNEACAACHGPSASSPLKPSHPPKEQCLICHKAK